MTKKDIIRKLTSRKFWLAVVSFVTSLLAAFGVADSTAGQVAGIIMAGATALGYIIGEGLNDAARTKNTVYMTAEEIEAAKSAEEEE